jgi:site-specific recombinase XerD
MRIIALSYQANDHAKSGAGTTKSIGTQKRLQPGLSSKSVADIVQKRAKLAGLEGDFGGHSLRSGFVTEGARQGIALPALMAMTDHRSVASVARYFQAGSIADNPAAKLAGH